MEEMNELTAEERARILQHELEAVYGSSSYKIGRAVTWLPRHAKKGAGVPCPQRPCHQRQISVYLAKYHKIANKTTPTGRACRKRTTPKR